MARLRLTDPCRAAAPVARVSLIRCEP